MITVLTGANSFEIDHALREIVTSFDGRAEKVDGATLELKQLPDLLMGSTLFADKRLVIIKDIASNSSVWEKLPEWLARLSDDIQLVLVDVKLDKRTTAYKELKKMADVKEFAPWTDRDQQYAETWLIHYSKSIDLVLDKKLAHHIVARVGVDQWQLASAAQKLLFVDSVTPEVINSIIDANPSENVFQLFELALEGDTRRIHEMIRTLELTEEPYKLFALLASQAFQLAAVTAAESSDVPTKDFGIHPFVASKLTRYARRLGRPGARRIVKAFAETDADLKTSRGEPWLLIERTLVTISQ